MPHVRYPAHWAPRDSRLLPLAALALLPLLLLPCAAAAQSWSETGDAGPLPGNAQITVGQGPLTSISGNLATPGDVDMYCIWVNNPASFSACLQCVVIQGPHLWLFDGAGNGVAMNSMCQAGCKNLNSAFIGGVGWYYLAVAYDGVWPRAGALDIWTPAYLGQRAPDGPGAGGWITSWAGVGNVQPVNPYQIGFIGGSTFCDAATPAPAGTWGRLKQIYR